jgi:hypothetical protein
MMNSPLPSMIGVAEVTLLDRLLFAGAPNERRP